MRSRRSAARVDVEVRGKGKADGAWWWPRWPSLRAVVERAEREVREVVVLVLVGVPLGGVSGGCGGEKNGGGLRG